MVTRASSRTRWRVATSSRASSVLARAARRQLGERAHRRCTRRHAAPRGSTCCVRAARTLAVRACAARVRRSAGGASRGSRSSAAAHAARVALNVRPAVKTHAALSRSSCCVRRAARRRIWSREAALVQLSTHLVAHAQLRSSGAVWRCSRSRGGCSTRTLSGVDEPLCARALQQPGVGGAMPASRATSISRCAPRRALDASAAHHSVSC